jgi:uncharacterized protein YukE
MLWRALFINCSVVMNTNDPTQPNQELPENQVNETPELTPDQVAASASEALENAVEDVSSSELPAENPGSPEAPAEAAGSTEAPAEDAGLAEAPVEVDHSAEAPSEVPAEPETPTEVPTQPEAQEAPLAEATAEPEVQVVEEVPAAVAEEPEAQPAEEAAPAEADVPTAQPLEAAAPEAEVTADEAEQAEPAQPEAEAAGEETAETASDDATSDAETERAMHEALIGFIDEAVHQPEGLENLLGRATPQELILLMEYFNRQEEVRDNIRRVGLVKRTFDQMQSRMELPSEVQQRFSTALSLFNKKRSEFQAQREKQREVNAETKAKIIEELKAVVDANDMNRHDEVKRIQKTWKETGQVPKDKMDELNLAFRALLDQYYQQRKIHFELLDYDREINLKKKESLLEGMKTIVPPEDKREDREAWENASTLMEAAQLRWRSIGFVPKEELERVIEDYKDVLNQFYSLRREYFESLEQERQENATAKEELLAKMEAFKAYESKSPREWNDASQELRKLQEAWQEIGPAPREVNSDLWKKFREIGDAFYGGKTAFFRQFDDMRTANFEAKTKLVEEAEGLQESKDWGKTTRRLQEIQNQWKEVGPVPERHSQKLWSRFRTACDTFFEAKRDHFSAQREDEKRNLGLKRELIDRVKAVNVDEMGGVEEAIAEIKVIQQEWRGIGHVPFKEKDKIWDEFRGEVDKFFDDLRANRVRRSVDRTRQRVEELPEDARNATLKRQIMAVSRKIENARNTINQYENNMGFIAKGKKGDALRAHIEKEIEKERQSMKTLQKELRELRDLQKGKPAKAKEAPAEEKPKAEAEAETAPEEPVKEEPAAPEAEAEETAAPEASAETPAEEEKTEE